MGGGCCIVDTDRRVACGLAGCNCLTARSHHARTHARTPGVSTVLGNDWYNRVETPEEFMARAQEVAKRQAEDRELLEEELYEIGSECKHSEKGQGGGGLCRRSVLPLPI